MKRALMLVGLVVAIACGSSAGDMMSEAFDDVTDIPDAGAQSTDCQCEAGRQGDPGEQGPQGEPGHRVVFCADFGAFCGFGTGTFESMSDCSQAVSQFGDDRVVCTARNLQAAKSGDTGGCAAIATLDPCAFTPALTEPSRIVKDVLSTTPASAPISYDYPYEWGCEFDSTTTVVLGEGDLLFMSLHAFASANTNREMEFTVAYRLVGDTTNGTVLDHASVPTGPSTQRDFVAGSFVASPTASGAYEVGACVRQNAYCSIGDCGYFATLTGARVNVLAVGAR